MQFFHLHENQYIIHLRKKYSWERLKKVGQIMPGTYSEVFLKRLYSSVFENSVDLRQEYLKYYKDEYKDINQFMFWRYGVSKEIYDQLPNATDGFLTVFQTEWSIEDDDLLKEAFVSVFTELENENKN